LIIEDGEIKSPEGTFQMKTFKELLQEVARNSKRIVGGPEIANPTTKQVVHYSAPNSLVTGNHVTFVLQSNKTDLTRFQSDVHQVVARWFVESNAECFAKLYDKDGLLRHLVLEYSKEMNKVYAPIKGTIGDAPHEAASRMPFMVKIVGKGYYAVP